MITLTNNKYRITVLTLVSMLFVLQPIETVGGPRIPLFLLAFFGIWLLFKHKKLLEQQGTRYLKQVFLLLWIPGVISLWGTYSLEKTGLFVIGLPLLFAAAVPVYLLLREHENRHVLSTIISVTALVWVLDAYVQFIWGVDLLGVAVSQDGRITGPFEGNWRLGTLLSVTIPVMLHWLGRHGLLVQFIYLTLLLGVLFLTGVRTNLIVFFTAVFLYFIWSKKQCLVMFGGLVPAALMIGWLASSESDITHKKLDTFTQFSSLSYESLNRLLTGRLSIWAAGWNMAMAHPVTGVGAKAFNHAYNEYKRADDNMTAVNGHGGAYHAHHPWVSVLAETGFTGLFALLAIVGLVVRWTIHSGQGLNFQHNPWLLVFLLILFPFNSMLPIYVIWWFPIVLLALTAQIATLKQDSPL